MTTQREPWAHVATKDGKFAGVISATLNHTGRPPSAKAEAKWKREVAKFCGDFIADGFAIATVFSREEYNALLEGMPMWEPEKISEKPNDQADLFGGA